MGDTLEEVRAMLRWGVSLHEMLAMCSVCHHAHKLVQTSALEAHYGECSRCGCGNRQEI